MLAYALPLPSCQGERVEHEVEHHTQNNEYVCTSSEPYTWDTSAWTMGHRRTCHARIGCLVPWCHAPFFGLPLLVPAPVPTDVSQPIFSSPPPTTSRRERMAAVRGATAPGQVLSHLTLELDASH